MGNPTKGFSYTILRYVPDEIREEFVNIGALVHDQTTGEIVTRLTDDWSRAAVIDPAFSQGRVEFMAGIILEGLAESPMNRADLEEACKGCGGMLEFRSVYGGISEDPLGEIARIFERFVAPAVPAGLPPEGTANA